MIVTSLANCNKDKLHIDADPVVYLPGVWEMRTSSGQAGIINFEKGNGNRLEFNSSNYRIFQNGSLLTDGRYEVAVDTSLGAITCLTTPAAKFTHVLIYDGQINNLKTYININGNRLTLISGCLSFSGGKKLEYEKIADR